ncbi:MAG TPA: transcription antitermination factor NusB [Anaerovoracaceae bacterium]|nr:transcription antitermination factor NusB [Anaerovoracaceae bacterium]
MSTKTRTEIRELLMQIYFEMDAQGLYDMGYIDKQLTDRQLGDQEDYFRGCLIAIFNNRETVDGLIDKYSTKWSIARIAKVDLAIMRLAICEMLYVQDVPAAVAINEAVELAKKYADDESPKYINAILGKVAREDE